MKGTHIITSLFLCAGLLNVAVADDIYKVKHIGQGKSLQLKQFPSRNSNTIVALPHDASWMVRRDKGRKVVDKVVWRQVQWNKHKGWVSDYYITKDPIASSQAAKRKQCLTDRNVKQKVCCGYSLAERKMPYKHIPILAVRNISVGASLALHARPSASSTKLVAMPHDTTWIADLGKRQKASNGATWAYVRWSGKTGWVNAAFLKADLRTTRTGDQKRKMCAITK